VSNHLSGYLTDEIGTLECVRQFQPLRCSMKQVERGLASVLYVKPWDTFIEANITRETGEGLTVPTKNGPLQGGL